MSWTPLSPWRAIDGTGQNLTIGASSTQSTAFNIYTQAIQISATGNCHIRVGQNPTAVATDMLIKASDPPYIVRVENGAKIAVIQDGASTGTLNVIEVTH